MAGTSIDAAVYAVPKFVKNTTVARVLPASTASTESPSRRRVVDRSFTSFWRFTQPSCVTRTMLSSATMSSSSVNSTLFFGLDQRAPLVELRVAVRLLNGFELLTHELPAAVLVLQQAADLPRALPLLLELLLDDQDLEPRQAVDLQLEDGIGLLGVELEPLHDLLGGVGLAVRLADDPEDFVEHVEDVLEAFEDDGCASSSASSSCSRRARDDVEPEMEEVPENRLQIEALRPARLRGSRSGSRHVRLTGKVVCSGVCL